MAERFMVEVAYCTTSRQYSIPVHVMLGSDVRSAIEASGILLHEPELRATMGVSNKIGIHGVLVGLDTLLEPDDRLEIYRPLICDPMTARHLRLSHTTQRARKKT